MSENNRQDIRELLRRAVPPANPELGRDLWPRMLRRLDERPQRVPWFDWTLVALVAIGALSWPEMIPILLYHL